MAFIMFDEHLGQVLPAGEVSFNRPKATVRELIRARVELEVERQATAPRPGVVPGAAERALNGERGAPGLGAMFLRAGEGADRPKLDRLVRDAEQGFALGRYFILLDDRQAESLDEEIDLGRTGEATFLLITPLQGG